MAARMRAMISIPLLMISFSSPLKKGREKGSLAAPDQSCPEHGEAALRSFSALPMSWIGLGIFAPKAK